MSEPAFAQLYRRFLGLVAQPKPLAEAAEASLPSDSAAAPLAGWIDAPNDVEAAARLGIYAHMYFARLRDSLREDYECVAALLSEETFARVALEYLLQHPSDQPSLRYHGRHFPRFLRERRRELELAVGPLRADLSELCQLEWARIEVFDAPEVELLHSAALAHLSERDWPELILQLIPAQRMLPNEYAVETLWRALTQHEVAPDPEPAAGALLVWRRGFAAYHRRVPADEARALRLLQAPTRLADLCGALAEGRDAESAAERTLQLLSQWLVDELLVAPERDK
jgi:hypothetical protein